MLMLLEAQAPDVEPSTRTVWVHVREADIAAGCRNSTSGCMIALALSRTFNGPACVFGLSAAPQAFVMGVHGVFALPHFAARQARRFDNGLHVAPFSFPLTVPR